MGLHTYTKTLFSIDVIVVEQALRIRQDENQMWYPVLFFFQASFIGEEKHFWSDFGISPQSLINSRMLITIQLNTRCPPPFSTVDFYVIMSRKRPRLQRSHVQYCTPS